MSAAEKLVDAARIGDCKIAKPLLKKLLKKQPQTNKSSHSKFYEALLTAEETNHPDFAHWLLENTISKSKGQADLVSPVGFSEAELGEIFIRACRDGHQNLAQFIHKSTPMIPFSGQALMACVSAQRTPMIKWLIGNFEFSREVKLEAVAICCAKNDITLAQRLFENFGLFLKVPESSEKFDDSGSPTKIAAREDAIDSSSASEKLPKSVLNHFATTCAHGDTDAASWLVDHLHLTDKMVMKSKAFYEACVHCHPETVQWLIKKFHLSRQNFRLWAVLESLSADGHLEMLMWIKITFNVTFLDLIHGEHSSLRAACYHGKFIVVKWLVESFGLTPENANIREAITFAGSYPEIVSWLREKFSLPEIINGEESESESQSGESASDVSEESESGDVSE